MITRLCSVSGIKVVLVDAECNDIFQLRLPIIEMPNPSFQSYVIWRSTNRSSCLSNFSAISFFTPACHFHAVTVSIPMWLCRKVLHRHVGWQRKSLARLLGAPMPDSFLRQYLLSNFIYSSQRAYRCCWKGGKKSHLSILDEKVAVLLDIADSAVAVRFYAFCRP